MALCSPQVASGPLADLGYVEEVCLGDIPVTPSLITCRRRSTSLALTKDSYDSEEVRSDRMTSDSRHGIRRVAGDIVTELSPGAHADFMKALLGGVWFSTGSIDLTANDCTTTVLANGRLLFTFATTIAALGLQIGDMLHVTGTGNADYDLKLFSIAIFQSATEVEVIPPMGFAGAGATLDAGEMHMDGRLSMGNIYRSFTMERAFTDIGSFIVYTGCRINSMAVDLPPTGIATATYGVLGKDATEIRPASIDGVAEIVLDQTTLTSLTFNAAAGTITAAAGNFLTAGIRPGDRVIVDGAGITHVQNRNPRTVTAVTATVLTVAEAIQSGGPYTGAFTVTRVGLPAYTAAVDNSVLVAVSGVLLINGMPAATVTAMSFTIDNQMAGSDVVGSNVVPIMLYGNQCMITGTMTVLFDRGGTGEDLYNAFDQEIDDVSIGMRLENADGTQALSFFFPRCKINTGTIGDAVAEGLPVSVDFRALKPKASMPERGTSQIVIADSTVAGVAPFQTLIGKRPEIDEEPAPEAAQGGEAAPPTPEAASVPPRPQRRAQSPGRVAEPDSEAA